MQLNIGVNLRCLFMVLLLLSASSLSVFAGTAAVVTHVDTDDSRILLQTDGEVEKYRYYELSNPSRLVVDIYGVKPDFSDRSILFAGVVSRLRIGLYEDKTRFVFDVAGGTNLDFGVGKDGNAIKIDWNSSQPSPVVSAAPAQVVTSTKSASKPLAASVPVKAAAAVSTVVKNVEFGLEGDQSVLTITYVGASAVIPAVLDKGMVRFGLQGSNISRSLRRIIDTAAFPSIIRRVTPYTASTKSGQNTLFAVELRETSAFEFQANPGQLVLRINNGEYGALVAPADETVVIPVLSSGTETTVVTSVPPSAGKAEKPIAEVDKTTPSLEGSRMPPSTDGDSVVEESTERVSLRFEKADIHMVLQLIADISMKNIIATDEVKGTVTLKLDDVPWRQALSVILEVSELGMLESGNVIRIRPVNKIREVEQARLSANQTKEKLVPLVTEYFEINYSDLGSIVAPLKELLSERGKFSRDDRNKQLIVTDVPLRLEQVRKLIRAIDLPVRQVMIEARIIEVDSTFSRDLGAKWGISYNNDSASGSSSLDNAGAGLGGGFLIAPSSVSSGLSAGVGVDMTFGRIGIDSTVLDLRLSAIETSGYGKVVSRPRITTVTGGEAMIKQGTKIPYQALSDKGIETKFEEANLVLTVTPVINPDNSVILDFDISNDSVGSNVSTGAGSAPAINTKNAKSTLVVKDGETTVIGGVFVESENDGHAGVPFLMDIPLIGKLFQSRNKSSRKSELLIFITPKILN